MRVAGWWCITQCVEIGLRTNKWNLDVLTFNLLLF
jgi:hypothetical protein